MNVGDGTSLNRDAYAKLVAEDVRVLRAGMPPSLEKEHIIVVLFQSVELLYDAPADSERLRRDYAALTGRWDDLVTAVVPAARLVWEEGGWSGNSGNWPLVDAWDKLASLKASEPEVFAQVSEKIDIPERTDAPCTLCFGSGKHRGKTIAEFQGESFAMGKDTAQLIISLLEEKVAALEEALAERTKGFDAPHRIERADDRGGIYVWSDGHRHAFVPKSHLIAALAPKAPQKRPRKKTKGPKT